MAQSTITSYFSNRKRPAPDDFKVKSKVLVLDQSAAPLGYDLNSTENVQSKQVAKKLVMARSKPTNNQANEQKPTARVAPSKSTRNAKQPDLSNFFNKPKAPSKTQQTSKDTETSDKPTVPFEIRGPLSPVKRKPERIIEAALKASETEVAPTGEPKPKESAVHKARKELSLGEIKTRLTRSPRAAELKERLDRIVRERDQRAQFDNNADKSTPVQPNASPRLNKFQSIEVEVPGTPTKSPLTSPRKLLASPRLSPGSASPSKIPAYQRFSALAEQSTPESKLVLPYSYRLLAELFRCVDIVVSMMNNRRETVTFKKLKSAVQEMRRRTFTERHLAQMLTVLPDAFQVSQEKIRSFGSMAKDKYEMVVIPLRKTDSGTAPAEPNMMTPTILAERQQDFYKSLLEIAKNHHDMFLRSLDSPLFVAKDQVTRWHPEFLMDNVPEVVPAELPAGPGEEKISSAKDVLAHARHLFTSNPRMAKALESVAASQQTGNMVTVEVVDAESNGPPSPAVPPSKPNITTTLKGIPKALLEKVRARQAAKALDVMTRSPAQDKEVVMYSRLPEIARILRNCYVVEKKGVMPLEVVVEKVSNSYRNSITRGELEEHFKLLAREVPGWITFDRLRNTDFVRLSKGADMNRVMKKLETLAEQKTGLKV